MYSVEISPMAIHAKGYASVLKVLLYMVGFTFPLFTAYAARQFLNGGEVFFFGWR
jgi:hypothetical protein